MAVGLITKPKRKTRKIAPYGSRDAGIPMTLDEFEAAEFELGSRYEIIRGLLVVSPAPLAEERGGNEYLGYLLLTYKEHHPQGSALDATLPEHDIRTGTQIRRCDRAIWVGLGRRPRTRGRPALRDRPSIVVEFPSSRRADQRRDYVEKQEEYRDLGVLEYLIIDRFARQMVVYHWRGSRWVKRVLGERDTYRTPLLPGFELPLAKLFAVMDEYTDAPTD
ncbi:MAG: Uma2 family endonuclease [Planctomycetes bacterium]|nr:Uma2 family endonuclease [Planctomycetota bacterium]